MRPPKPEICPYCLEEDELVWDKESKEWLCSLCVEDIDERDAIRDYEEDEALKYLLDEEDMD